MVDEVENNKNCILYEFLILSEWIKDCDNVISKNVPSNSLQESTSYFNPWKLFQRSKFQNLRFLETEYLWHLAVSKDGKVIAVLQETLLEIKTAKDEFSSVVGKAYLPNDQFPKLRKLCWSPDNSFLAIARDHGTVHIFNLFGCIIATVEPTENNIGTLQPVVGLCFLQSKFDSSKWSNELLIIYHKGDVKSILLSHLDGYESDENIKYSLENYYLEGISAVAYGSHHLLIIAGPPRGNEYGITVWRILNDFPYLKIAIDSERSTSSSRSFLRLLPAFLNQNNSRTILKMQISPDEKLIACLHLSGEISLWRLPGILLQKKWNLHEQPQYDICNPEKTKKSKNDQDFYPVDISWWSNDALVIARKNGALSVCTITTLCNILGDSPEFLAGSPQISSIIGDRPGVIALECDTSYTYKKNLESDENTSDKEGETSVLQASIQAALYSFTDIEMFEPKRKTPKIKQCTYRLLALKRTTPEELYARKIDHEEYEEALLLAKKYNLDCDLVYQKRWRNSPVSKESINNYLDKIKKIHWVVKECVERVPENLEDAKELLEFGLRKTELKNRKFSTFNSEQKQLVRCRRQLFRFLDNLTIYEKMIGLPSKYNSSEYDDFRKKPAIVATVNFARQENWQAVSIMFTYVGNKILTHWLPILSNFPETLKPLMYRSLLPEVVENEVIPWEVKKLRDADWSENSFFGSLSSDENDDGGKVLYEEDLYLKEFRAEKITTDIVEEWYKRRTYELENKTGLVENALMFVVLAEERGIRNLNHLHSNLLTLESLAYLVGDDNITLTKLEALSHLEQCKLLLSKTSKETFIDDLKNLILPFTKRCKRQNCDSNYSLLRNILLHFSETSLELPLELLSYLKEGFLNPLMLSLRETAIICLDCIYSCPKDDQLETCFLILECLPQRENNNSSREDTELHDRIDRLEFHLEICEILNRYKISKSVRFIYENENNVEVGKELMENMAEYTKRESLDFTELLSDLQFMQSRVFTSIPNSYCYELCALSQMSCECEEIIKSAENIIECRKGDKDKMVPFEKSVDLVLQASRDHFEKATNFDDFYIQLAQTCLKLIEEPHSQIYEELDLIEAVQLLGDFHVDVLPLQVRKHCHRIELIQSCLKAKSKNYKACQRLLQLAQTLRIYGDDRLKREGEVLVMIAEHALNSSDYQYCSEICHRLVTRNFPPAWTIVRLLAQTKEYENKNSKKLFLAFALLHCPVESVEELIESSIILESEFLKKIQIMNMEIEGFDVKDESNKNNEDIPQKKKKALGGFQSFGLSFPVLKGLQKRGYKVPTPIQRKTIPLILQGRDVVAMARTGSGKTACFLLPMFEKLKKKAPKSLFGARALILSPTRELALQTIKFIKDLGRFTKLKAFAVLGGDSMDYQFDALHNNPDIIVATPGRFLHLCVEMDLKLNSVEYVVFDEADRLFEMGFGEQLKEILDRLGDSRQTVLFSATLPKLLIDFAKAGLSNPVLLRLDVESKLPDTLDIAFLSVNQDEKLSGLLCILQSLPKNSQTIVFTATKHHVEYLHMVLDKAGISNTFIYSDLDPSARKINAGKFQNKKCSVLLVTDIAARGVDIPQLDYVINYHFPAKSKLFVHRVGRCARAGRSGTAFSLVSLEEAPYVLDLHLFLGRRLNLIPVNYKGKKIDQKSAFGKIPAHLIESQQCELIDWHNNNDELTSMERVSSNAYKKYLHSRPGASVESVKRLKELNLKNLGNHPFFISQDNEETKAVELLEQMKQYKPKGTVFELNVSNKSKCYSVMKKTKRAHECQILNFKKKQEEKERENKENLEDEKLLLMQESKKNQTEEASNEIERKKRKSESERNGGMKFKKKTFVDEEYYVPHFAPDQHTEQGLAINNFTSEANKAMFDLSGDCDEGFKIQKLLKKWDKKKMKMVNVPGQKVGKIKTESGNWISASYKSNKYAQWKEKSKIVEANNDEEEDGDENEESKQRNVKKKEFPNTRWGRHNRKIAEKFKAKAKLKKPEQILKKRKELERRRQKSIPRSQRKNFWKGTKNK